MDCREVTGVTSVNKEQIASKSQLTLLLGKLKVTGVTAVTKEEKSTFKIEEAAKPSFWTAER